MKLNRTTQRTVEILKLVSKNPEGITLDEICEKLSLPKTSAYDIVTTLAEMGMVNVDRGQRQRYTIGLTAYRIVINYTNNLDFISVTEPELKAFAKTVGKTVFFGVRSDHEVVYICKAEPENPIITTATVGSKNPMHCTSLGKAILAYSDPETQAQVIPWTPGSWRSIWNVSVRRFSVRTAVSSVRSVSQACTSLRKIMNGWEPWWQRRAGRFRNCWASLTTVQSRPYPCNT